MLFSGKIAALPGGKARVLTHFIRELEKRRCEVVRSGNRLDVGLPGAEAWIFPGDQPVSQPAIFRFFQDRFELDFDGEGEVTYRMRYWGWTQVLLHTMITSAFLLDYLANPAERGLAETFRWLWLANLLPVAACYAVFLLVRHGILGKAEAGLRAGVAVAPDPRPT